MPLDGEYEALLAASPAVYDFPDLDEDTCATTFYTTGTTGLPKGVYYSHRQLVLHTLGGLTAMAMAPHQGGFHADDVYMPITPMFHAHAWGYPYMATLMGVKQVYPGRYEPAALLGLIEREKVTVSHCVATIMFMLLRSEAMADRRREGLEGHHRRRAAAAGPSARRRWTTASTSTAATGSARPARSSRAPTWTRR